MKNVHYNNSALGTTSTMPVIAQPKCTQTITILTSNTHAHGQKCMGVLIPHWCEPNPTGLRTPKPSESTTQYSNFRVRTVPSGWLWRSVCNTLDFWAANLETQMFYEYATTQIFTTMTITEGSDTPSLFQSAILTSPSTLDATSIPSTTSNSFTSTSS